MLPTQTQPQPTPQELEAWRELSNEPLLRFASGQPVPPATPPPASLDVAVQSEPTQPEPLNLPPFVPMSKLERDLYLPLYALSKGVRIPEDDDFMASLYVSHIADEFEREAKLQAFDAYRRTLEMRAEHDQRIRQLFAPIASDFNSVFSAEMLNTALSEVIEAYKATNPKISWNKLSPQSRMMFIRELQRQGKLPPTLQNLLEQWRRLRGTFMNYRQLLHPQDAQVVAELEGILGGSVEEFLMPFLTRKDPQEELQEEQRRQLQLYEQLQRRFASPLPTSGQASPSLTFGGGRGGAGFSFGGFGGGGGGGGGGGSVPQQPVVDAERLRYALNRNRQFFTKNIKYDEIRGSYTIPEITDYTDERFIGEVFGQDPASVVRNILPGEAGFIAANFVGSNPSIASLRTKAAKLLRKIRSINFSNPTNEDRLLLAEGLASLFLLQYANFVAQNKDLLPALSSSREAQSILISELLSTTISLAGTPFGDRKDEAIRKIKGFFNLQPHLSTPENYRVMAETNQQPGDRQRFWAWLFKVNEQALSTSLQQDQHKRLDEKLVRRINAEVAPYITVGQGKTKPIEAISVKYRLGIVRTYGDVVRLIQNAQTPQVFPQIVAELERQLLQSPFGRRRLDNQFKTEIAPVPYVVKEGNEYVLYLVVVPVKKPQNKQGKQQFNPQRTNGGR